MNLLKISLLSLVIILTGCSEKVSELDKKKAELKSLKQQFTEVKYQIANLQEELSSLDTVADGGVPVSNLDSRAWFFFSFC